MKIGNLLVSVEGIIGRYSYFLIFILVITVSLVLRSQYVFSERIWPDEALYAWYAEKILIDPAFLFSKEIVAFHPPLFALLLALSHSLAPSLIAGQAAAFLLGIFGIGAVYFLGRRVGSGFTGSLAAALLAVNPVYLCYSTKILPDTALLFVLILLAGLLLDLDRAARLRHHVLIGIVGTAAVMLKWSGILVIPWIAACYLGGFRQPISVRIKSLLVPVAMICTAAGLLIYHHWLHYGKIFPYGGSAFYQPTSPEPAWFYLLTWPHQIGWAGLIPFALWGCYVTVRRPREGVVLVSWLVIFTLALSLPAEKLLRYSLLTMPCLLLLTALGVEDVLKRIFRAPDRLKLARGAFTALAFLVFIAVYPALESDLKEDNKFYRGFPEAGAWIAAHLQKDTLILSSSPRLLRYHARLGTGRPDVVLWRWPLHQEKWARILTEHPGHIILEIDNWGRPGQPRLDPFVPSQLNPLEQQGFQLRKTFGRLRYKSGDGRFKVAPAIWIFER